MGEKRGWVSFIEDRLAVILNIRPDEHHETLLRIYAILTAMMIMAFVQAVNFVQLFIRDGGVGFDGMVSLAVLLMSTALIVMLRYVKSPAPYVVIITIVTLGSILMVNIPDKVGINSALLPYFVMVTFFMALIGGWRASIIFSILAIATMKWLYSISLTSDPSVLLNKHHFFNYNTQRFVQTIFVVFITFALSAVYAYVTNKKMKRLEKIEARLDQTKQNQTEALANISHELRTPMMGVLGLSDLLVHSNLLEKEKNYAKVIFASAETTSRMIDNVVTFSQLGMDAVTLGKSRVNIRALLERIVEPYKNNKQAQTSKITINISPDFDQYVIADNLRLMQIFHNIVDNAFRFTRGGDVEISASLGGFSQVKTLTFKCKDNGIGISKEHQEKIFQEFFRVDGSFTRKYGGIGLGLTVAKGLVKHMGGDIEILSALNEGTIVTITIPVLADIPEDMPKPIGLKKLHQAA